MKNMYYHSLIIIVLALFILAGCEPAGEQENPPGDTTPPTASATPSGGTIDNTTPIVILFSESMKTSTCSINGTLVLAMYEAEWTQTVSTDDTLTLSPDTSWSPGPDQTLIIDCEDLAGNSMTEPLNLQYTVPVVNTIIYVNGSTGNDGNDGTIDYPRKTIQAGIDAAVSGMEVHVAGGTYSSDYSSSGSPCITLKQGVNVFGGYAPDFSGRNTSTYETIVEDTSVSGGSISPNRAVYGDAGITVSTILDGFTINGSGGDLSAAVLNMNGSSPSIQNCIINGGPAVNASYGIYNDSTTAASIAHCTITGSSGSSSYGIYNNNADSSIIDDCTVNGGGGSSNSYGIYNTYADVTVTDSTVEGGTGNTAYGIYNTNCDPVISENSNIYGGDGNATYAVYNNYADTIITGNAIHGGNASTSSYGIYNNSHCSTTINNNSIIGGSADNSYGVYNRDTSNSAIEYNSSINGGMGDKSYAIYIDLYSDVIIQNNTDINAGGSVSATMTYGIYINGDSDPVIKNNSSINGGTGDTSYGIYCSTNCDPVISGNTEILAGTGETSFGIYGASTATLQVDDNVVSGGNGSVSYGIFLTDDSTNISRINGNTIHGGDGTSSSYAVRLQFCGQTSVWNNCIFGGTGNNSYGISLRQANPRIRNNTINGGSQGALSYGIFLEGSSTACSPAIDNNIIFISGGTTRCAIHEETTDSDPVSLRNNDIYDMGTGGTWIFYRDWFNISRTTIAELNDYNNTTQNASYPSSGNVSSDPVFKDIDGTDNDMTTMNDNDWQLTIASPASVRQNGLNGAYSTESWGFTKDKSGSDRSPLDDSNTTGWSMGAYEF